MLTSFDNLPEVNSLIMGYHLTGYECALSQRWSSSPLLQTLYVTSYHQDNDIRYITGIFDNISSSGIPYNPSPAGYYAAKLTSSQANGNYGGGQIASGSSQYHYVWWTGSQIYSLSNLTGPGITVQATQHPAHGLLRTSSSSTSNCTAGTGVVYVKIYYPVGDTFATTTAIFWDPFECKYADPGYHSDPVTKERRYWYSTNYFYTGSLSNTSYIWNQMQLDHSSSGVGAVCNNNEVDVYQLCNSGNWATDLPILNASASAFAPTGYYAQQNASSGDVAYYWNGTTGWWGSGNSWYCSVKSDIRTKENIVKTGVSESGLPMYDFNYIGEKERWNGVMAQDLLKLGRKDAVIKDKDTGFYSVMYDKIDVDMKLI